MCSYALVHESGDPLSEGDIWGALAVAYLPEEVSKVPLRGLITPLGHAGLRGGFKNS